MTDTNIAREANSPERWNRIWGMKEEHDWREKVLAQIYERIVQIIPKDSNVADLGGGVGTLGCKLKETKNCDVTIYDHSVQALNTAQDAGLNVCNTDFEETIPEINTDIIVATEFIEHLSPEARENILHCASRQPGGALFSVPNDRLGPEEESQHTIKYTTIEFKRELQRHFTYVRIEVFGGYLLGICGPLARKNFTLSVTLPIRDEAHDIEKTLASFRGVADQLIVGIDPRTIDNTAEIVEKYADEFFYIESPQGPPDEYQGDNKVHFSWCRNQCIDKCTGEWIFMTEGHEYLAEGQDILLKLDEIMPKSASVGMVFREGNGQRWGFPWLFRNSDKIRFTRPIHNTLDFPLKAYVVKLPQIVTKHERDHRRGKARAEQRKAQNRLTLFDDWLERHSEHSLFYLAQEWREYDSARSKERFEQFLKISNNGGQRYQARLILARQYMRADDLKHDMKKARDILIPAVGDDWTRAEHWIWLGDIAFNEEKFEEAYIFYRYATNMIGELPFTLWWIDISNYTYLPAQRMALVCGEMGRLEEGCIWAKKVTELLPDDAPDEMINEAEEAVRLFEEALNGATQRN